MQTDRYTKNMQAYIYKWKYAGTHKSTNKCSHTHTNTHKYTLTYPLTYTYTPMHEYPLTYIYPTCVGIHAVRPCYNLTHLSCN